MGIGCIQQLPGVYSARKGRARKKIVDAFSWYYEHAKNEEFYAAIADRRNKKTPLDDKPNLDAVSLWYIEVYGLLSMGRQSGMTASPIELQDIVLYWDRVDRIGPLKEFIGVIRAIDSYALSSIAGKESGKRHKDRASNNR